MINLTSIEGNRQWLDGGSMFGNAPRAVWEKWTEVDELGRIPLACRCLLIEAPQGKILLEAGIGAFFEKKLAQRFGVQDSENHCLLENLKKKGLSPHEIDFVILSHLHFDHAGGLLPTYHEMQKNQWSLAFPNAQIIVGDQAWNRAQGPHSRDRASFIPELNKKLQASDKLIVVKNEVPPDSLKGLISFFTTEGHTPGQLHTVVHGTSQSVVFCGDLIPGLPWVHLPITMGYDRFPEKLIEEKQNLYEKWESKKWSAFFTHDPNIALAKINKTSKGRYEAADPVKEIDRLSI